MSAQEEMPDLKGFECCHSLMDQFCNPGSGEEKDVKIDAKSCEQMMKQFCAGKDGKFDFETFRSKTEQFCRTMNNKEKN